MLRSFSIGCIFACGQKKTFFWVHERENLCKINWPIKFNKKPLLFHPRAKILPMENGLYTLLNTYLHVTLSLYFMLYDTPGELSIVHNIYVLYCICGLKINKATYFGSRYLCNREEKSQFSAPYRQLINTLTISERHNVVLSPEEFQPPQCVW